LEKPYIKKIEIKNFRNIDKQDFEATNLNILVGANDVGKSNYLRALNLFFNGETDNGKPFNFNDDFCKFAKVSKKMAKEISIEITFDPPFSYNKGKKVKWKKIWRETGFYKEEIKYADNKELKSRTKVKSWINKIQFKYIPAIKGDKYFALLLSDLYETLSFTIRKSIKIAGNKFVGMIRNKTKLLSRRLLSQINIDSNIELPTDLSNLFSTLDFDTKKGSNRILLSFRGDGIKARYIPIIHEFIADKIKTKNINTIWGYEEPENNLEISKTLELAKEFVVYSKKIQIFSTTHSPAFYSLRNQGESCNFFHVFSHKKSHTKLIPIDDKYKEHLDRTLGLLDLIAPYIEQKNKEIIEIQKRYNEIEKDKLPTLFVEGVTDKKILLKAFGVFDSQLKDKINIKTKKGAGINWVKDMLITWAHSGKEIKAMGLFDYDTDSEKAIDDYRDIEKCKNNTLVKSESLKNYKPQNIVDFFKKHIKLYFSIEDFFSIDYLKKAEEKGWTEPKNDLHLLNNRKEYDKSLIEICKTSGISDDYLIYLKKN
jgi:AAA15 family ATPase/GTPase